jgi:LmbE family N-acetylglucosaminyl deacetylase
VFFAPHPDDEVLAMGGAIAEHVASGRPVFVEMLTHGTASGVLGALNNGQSCSWHSGSHVYNLTAQEFGESRVREFKQAASLLGVKGVYVSELGDGQLQNKKPQIQERIQWWIAQVGTGLSLKGIATLSAQDHADHRALWSTLLASGWGDIRGYAYSAGTAEGTSSTANAVALGTYCAPKVDSFKAYKTWNPGAGRYAVGYHSVSSFFDTIGAECKEYRVAP